MVEAQTLKIDVPSVGQVSALLQLPKRATALFVLGHGTGSDMQYSVISGLATALTKRGVAVLRFHYPYSDHPDYVPQSGMATDTRAVMITTIRAAVDCASALAPELPLFAGGHSLSADLVTYADRDAALPVRGVILLGYPLRDAGVAHLQGMSAPALFVQGDRDHLGSVVAIERAGAVFGARGAVRIIEGADHRFERDGVAQSIVLEEVAGCIFDYVGKFC